MTLSTWRTLAAIALIALNGCQSTPERTLARAPERSAELINSVAIASSTQCDKEPCVCKTRQCVILVDVSECAKTDKASIKSPTLQIQSVHAAGTDPFIIWAIDPPSSPYVFLRGTGIVLKDANADPTGQFYDKYVLDGFNNPNPTLKKGKRYQWRDRNFSVDDDKYEYRIILKNEDGGHDCTLDPTIHNLG